MTRARMLAAVLAAATFGVACDEPGPDDHAGTSSASSDTTGSDESDASESTSEDVGESESSSSGDEIDPYVEFVAEYACQGVESYAELSVNGGGEMVSEYCTPPYPAQTGTLRVLQRGEPGLYMIRIRYDGSGRGVDCQRDITDEMLRAHAVVPVC